MVSCGFAGSNYFRVIKVMAKKLLNEMYSKINRQSSKYVVTELCDVLYCTHSNLLVTLSIEHPVFTYPNIGNWEKYMRRIRSVIIVL